MEKEENVLGTEKIGKLIRTFSIPAIISLLVNSLYNIVDQIFIGRGVGYLGNGATNVVFPLTVIALAFSLMFGDGTAAYLSLKLGEKKKKEAEKGAANGILISIIISIIYGALTLIFLPQLLTIFGCTENLREYALAYGRIIALGLPFMMIGTTLSSIIRADGSPKYTMATMVAGAVINTILDPIFIFVFKMGVEGAAIATIFSQFITFIFNVTYIRKFKTINLSKETFKLKFSIIRRIAMLGISSFITQMSFVFVIAVQNNLLAKYGTQSKYGQEIPITVVGIVMKINQILNSIIIGIVAGAQPIFGYNYGAKKYDRVKSALKIVLALSISISTIAFILFKAIPDKLISIFGSGDANYIEFACMTFRIFLMLCICNGIQIPAGIFFQAIGKSIKSAILSTSRLILFLIPAMFVLSSIYGVEGVLYAGPVADGLAFAIAITFLGTELKNLNQGKTSPEENIENETIEEDKNEHIVITISREYGSGGRYVGKLVAERLGIRLYDKEIITKMAQKTGLSVDYIKENEQKRSALAALNQGYYAGLNSSDKLFVKEAELIKELADKESCVIVGRCANFILKDRSDVVKVFVYSDMEGKIKRATEFYGLNRENAKKEISRINKLRASHYKHYTEQDWDDFSNYDICINSDALGIENSAELICKIQKSKMNENVEV